MESGEDSEPSAADIPVGKVAVGVELAPLLQKEPLETETTANSSSPPAVPVGADGAVRRAIRWLPDTSLPMCLPLDMPTETGWSRPLQASCRRLRFAEGGSRLLRLPVEAEAAPWLQGGMGLWDGLCGRGSFPLRLPGRSRQDNQPPRCPRV